MFSRISAWSWGEKHSLFNLKCSPYLPQIAYFAIHWSFPSDLWYTTVLHVSSNKLFMRTFAAGLLGKKKKRRLENYIYPHQGFLSCHILFKTTLLFQYCSHLTFSIHHWRFSSELDKNIFKHPKFSISLTHHNFCNFSVKIFLLPSFHGLWHSSPNSVSLVISELVLCNVFSFFSDLWTCFM